MSNILDLVKSEKLTYEQIVLSLAHAAESTLDVLHIPEKQPIISNKMLSIICLKAMLHIDQDTYYQTMINS